MCSRLHSCPRSSLSRLDQQTSPCRRHFAAAAASTTSTHSSQGPTFDETSSGKKEPLVLWEMDDETKIGTLTLNSPKDYNALSMEMGDEFLALCRQLTDQMLDELDCRVVILQGMGDHAFSAGGHLEWLKSFSENTAHRNVDLMLQFYKKFLSIRQLPVPVVAALSGPAMGAGAGLALACDLRTAANKSKILGLNFARLGIHSVRAWHG
jgi:enoyl-CoA hydratase/carnithine racemase